MTTFFRACVALAIAALAGFGPATLAASPAPPAPPADGDLDLARRLEGAFERVAEEASRSVVVITSVQKAKPAAAMPPATEDGEQDGEGDEEDNGRQPRGFEGTPWEWFFRNHPGGPLAPQPPHDINSQGSGVILRADGFILTNNHVIDGADEIKVRLQDGREFPAKVIGVDDRTDVAVLKVEGTDLPAAKLGDSDRVRVGQWAIAIGAPYQLEYTFTVGFISAKGRSVLGSRGGSAYEDYLQTDASINPGNSGGPLCDIEGRVLGINTMIRGLNRGIGFAIPINMAREIADQLIARGKIVRPWIGIQIETLEENQDLGAAHPTLQHGVVVRAIYPGTPAAASDLKPADIITAVDGNEVKNPRDLQREILRKGVGQEVRLSVLRDAKAVEVKLKTGQLPERTVVTTRREPAPAPVAAAWGVKVQDLTPAVAERLGLESAAGVVVTDVAEDSPARRRGLQRGDVITEANHVPVQNSGDFQKALGAGDPQKGVLLYVRRGATATFLVLKEKE